MNELLNYILILGLGLLLIYKLNIRLRLSAAKHSSLRGHSKISRRIARIIPFFEYTEEQFFNSDGAPEDISEKRKTAFNQLKKYFNDHYSESIKFSDSLQSSISDIDFTNAYRVPFPYRNYLRNNIKSASVVTESSGVKVKDLDGNWNYDLTGSYGVNVFGYDFYKDCMQKAFEKTKSLGPVLGAYHPLIKENVDKLKKISNLDEVSFHMSGTEAVMQAVRLARYHTGKTHLVRFCGAYHGWWDGVQPGIGNQRKTNDVYTLADLSEKTLRVLQTRNDIACILINPLQAFHPNADASSDASLVNSDRTAKFDRKGYTEWLRQLRDVCNRRSIVLIMDEVFTGFRLAYGGAQEYFSVQADIVTYGKTLGGGMPVGVVCGKHQLMKRYKEDRPVNVSFARGTFNSHPYVMSCMNEFLKRIDDEDIQAIYEHSNELWKQRVAILNDNLVQASVPVRVESLMSIWTILYTQPCRYNWMFQFYLKRQGLSLSWVGSGRIIMSHNFSDEDYMEVVQKFVKAALEMQADGWWWKNDKLSNKAIKQQMFKEMLMVKLPLLGRMLPDRFQRLNKNEKIQEAKI